MVFIWDLYGLVPQGGQLLGNDLPRGGCFCRIGLLPEDVWCSGILSSQLWQWLDYVLDLHVVRMSEKELLHVGDT
jgi:hypothetical protein